MMNLRKTVYNNPTEYIAVDNIFQSEDITFQKVEYIKEYSVFHYYGLKMLTRTKGSALNYFHISNINSKKFITSAMDANISYKFGRNGFIQTPN